MACSHLLGFGRRGGRGDSAPTGTATDVQSKVRPIWSAVAFLKDKNNFGKFNKNITGFISLLFGLIRALVDGLIG